ncbi:MAG: membrane protein insertase YidC [Acidobacteria bacterium]|nr:MAG: membrane protein insertase YidC [Acidobacteriota bacterium]
MALNNNDDPGFERRLIVALGLMFALFLVVMPFLNKDSKMPTPQQAEKKAPITAQAPAAKPSGVPPSVSVAPAAGAKAAKTAPAKAAPKAAPIAAHGEQAITVNTPAFKVVFSNRGADVHSWVLTQYKDDAGKPLDVVGPSFSKEFGYPLAFWSKDAALRQQLDNALYQFRERTAANGDQILTFTWSNGSLLAKKTFTFSNSYEVEVDASLTRDGQPVGASLAWQGAFGDRPAPGDFDTEKLFHQSGSSVTTIKGKDVNTGTTEQGVFQFVGVEDHYFAMAFLPNQQPSLTVTRLKNQYKPRLVDASGNVTTNKPVDTVGLAISTGGPISTRVFVGPKKLSLLSAADPALRGLVDFGWFSFVAEPLFLWMNWTYVHWVPNYGWAILFITFIITMATFPLKMMAQKSQAKMMALQPKINSLNAKMKRYPMRDPRRQEVQQEIMKVYSEHGVNPLGGCLPMLIQLPLIYAFWEMLETAFELRHAPWIGYIHDLSAKDPYYILPILLVISQFFMTALMPMTPGQDPRQAKLMKWAMPIFVGWFFFYLPSGVNLYYLGYNVISTGQQWVANKTYNDKAIADVAAHDKAKERDQIASGKSTGKKKVIEGKVVSPKR